MRGLAFESSCDETALAVWDSDQRKFLYEKTLTQIPLHRSYGGVVPAIAIREHLKAFPVLLQDLQDHFDVSTLTALYVTHGPGLIGSLGMGVAYAQSLQLLLQLPLYGVNHLQGHALSPFIECVEQDANFSFESICPHLGLLVSGGNTLLFAMESIPVPPCKNAAKIDKNAATNEPLREHLKFHVLAQTVDDAAGEAFDKGAILLGFPYPGGASLESCARQGDAHLTHFPRAFTGKQDLKFSFSGLKTSLRYFLAKLSETEIEAQRPSICAAYQDAIVDSLMQKVQQVLRLKAFKSLGLSGGVANNGVLVERLRRIADHDRLPLFVPKKAYCGDNAAMIAFAGCYQHDRLRLDPNRKLDDEIDDRYSGYAERASSMKIACA